MKNIRTFAATGLVVLSFSSLTGCANNPEADALIKQIIFHGAAAELRKKGEYENAQAMENIGNVMGIIDAQKAGRSEVNVNVYGGESGRRETQEELASYKAARSKWSHSDWEACVDRLGEFLQTYPSSVYADDAAYWRADCYFQQGNYKKAILRFDDVVARYPNGNKAADALYREGEALLRLGPAYNTAARKAFERVLAEYPDSDRAAEASQQLELL